ncbi:MAG: glycosyltransferase [Clostridiales bacterium]|nr:glycosyltransferase [Clostridiales bacterium]
MNLYIIANHIIAALFAVCYFYQIIYTIASMRRTVPPFPKEAPGRYAILICAHNEEAVIGQLIDSVSKQNYPRELIDIFVGADNCDDATARIAREHGATVYERSDRTHIGKGYVLNFLINSITGEGTNWEHGGFIVIDADNLLDSGYVAAMNDALCSGYRVVTGYRNSKNFGDNWLSASYAVWFLHESRMLNGARELLRLSAQVSGTGFAVSSELLRELGGWNYFTLTEDVEFTFAMTARGEKIGYTPHAILYDEQPTNFRVSWNQRMRWTKGYLQAYGRYGGAMLLRAVSKHAFPCYDMLMSTLAGSVLATGAIAFYAAAIVYGAVSGTGIMLPLIYLGHFLLATYIAFFIIGVITVITERSYIYAPRRAIIGFAFTFPFFFYTLLPLFPCLPFDRKIWPHIVHTRAIDIEEIKHTVDPS